MMRTNHMLSELGTLPGCAYHEVVAAYNLDTPCIDQDGPEDAR